MSPSRHRDVWRPSHAQAPVSAHRSLRVIGAVTALVLLAGLGVGVWLTFGPSHGPDGPYAGSHQASPTCPASGPVIRQCCPADRDQGQRTADCPYQKNFDAAPYAVSHGVPQFYCNDFASQADAQAVLRANPADPNRLARDGDGIACRGSPPPTDYAPVQQAIKACTAASERTARCPASKLFQPGYFAGGGIAPAYRCQDFASQADAQAVLRAAPTDPNKLDPHKTGLACPDLPAPKDMTPVPGG